MRASTNPLLFDVIAYSMPPFRWKLDDKQIAAVVS